MLYDTHHYSHCKPNTEACGPSPMRGMAFVHASEIHNDNAFDPDWTTLIRDQNYHSTPAIRRNVRFTLPGLQGDVNLKVAVCNPDVCVI